MDQIDDAEAICKQDNRFPLLVTEFDRNGRERVRVAIETYNGHPVFSVRAFYEAAPGDWRPGRAGINLSLRHLVTLHNGLTDAIGRCVELGWLRAADLDRVR